MEEPKRLFDCLKIQEQAQQTDLLNGKENGVWRLRSTAEVHQQIYELAKALLDLGISGGDGTTEGRDKIGLISNSRPEWIITDLAVQLTGAVLIPLYTNSNAREIGQILKEAEVKYLFVGTADLFEKANLIAADIPSLKSIFTFDELPNATHWQMLLKPVDDEGFNQIKEASNQIKETDVTTIIYTSGTTGKPKGVMLTHKNIVSNVLESAKIFRQVPMQKQRAFSFLPLNHIFEKMCTYIYLFDNLSISYAESLDTIAADMRDMKPGIFTAVPRLLEKIFEKIMIEGQKLTGVKKSIFFWAVDLAERFEIGQQNTWYKMQLALADKLVYSKWRAAIGGQIKAIVVGSSACPVRLARIFSAANIIILEGYGLTETSPVVAVNQYNKTKRKLGTVGPLLGGVEVKIEPDGEILCKGPNIMAGYYKNPVLTDEVLIDGWFHTGDIGELDSNRFLKITGRKKENFKTSGGKYVAPAPIENRMKESPFIEQMIVTGEDKKFTTALIVPSFINLKNWCGQQKLSCSSRQEIVKDEAVIAFYQSIVDGYNPEFNHVEQIKKFKLLADEWSIEGEELTPTGKMKRRVIISKYKSEIDGLYQNDVNHTSFVH